MNSPSHLFFFFTFLPMLSNYQYIQNLSFHGHEVAVEGISLQQGLQDKGFEEWVGEMVGMREILRHFSSIQNSDVNGMRAPFLKPGRNTQYKVVEDFGFIYDSSVVVPPSKIPVWPYTLDYKIPHDCKSGTCPTKSFPGGELFFVRELSICVSLWTR